MRTSVAAGMLTAVVVVFLAPAEFAVAGGAVRLLEGVRVDEELGAFVIRIGLTSAVRYVRHEPRVPADTLRVRLAPVGVGGWDADAGGVDALQPTSGEAGPLRSVRVERVGDEVEVELRFARTVPFEVSQGRDLRSLVVRVANPTPPPVAPPPAGAQEPGGQSAATPEVTARAAELMDAGKQAFTAGELPRAALIFDEAARMPENEYSPEALELLGLVRERAGQLAHAKAEYQEYLRRYPEGEAADRVRQRLATLTTARAVPKGPLRRRSESRPRVELNTFGDVYVGFRRESLFSDLGETLVDNSLLTDVHLDTRLRRRGVTLRSQLAASYWEGFLERGSEGRARIYSAFLEASDPSRGLAGSLGRRSASSRGVLGRYDGFQIDYSLGERFKVGAVAGFPLDTPGIEDFDPNRYMFGLSGSALGFWDALDASFFLISERDDGFTNRTAVGGELRYFSDGRMAAAFLDYDVYFQSLNVAQLIGSWQVTPQAFVSASVDYRNVPFLTLDNALIGQPVGSLHGLDNLFSQSQIEKLAEDRTSQATTISMSGSYNLSPFLQIGGDVVASRLTGTESSGGVDGFGSTDFELSYTARLVANDVLTDGDVGVFSLRYFDGTNSDLIGTSLDARYPLTRQLRLNPRLWADYRLNDFGSDMIRVIPSLRCDWRVFRFELESEVGFEWFEPLGGLDDRRLGYFLMLGARYNF